MLHPRLSADSRVLTRLSFRILGLIFLVIGLGVAGLFWGNWLVMLIFGGSFSALGLALILVDTRQILFIDGEDLCWRSMAMGIDK